MYYSSLDPETLPGWGGGRGLRAYDNNVAKLGGHLFMDLLDLFLQESGHDCPNHLYEQWNKNINKLLKQHLPMENV